MFQFKSREVPLYSNHSLLQSINILQSLLMMRRIAVMVMIGDADNHNF